MDRFRYKITIQYDGTRYHGWQIQKNHITIQSEIEKGIKDFCSQKTSVYGSGRTDSGVHAIGQVAHFDLSEKIEPKIILNALNAKINNDIKIIYCELMNNDFHARFSAKKRYYTYRLRTNEFLLDHYFTYHSGPLDFKLLNKASKLVVGEHDFTSFSKNNKKITNRRCIIYDSIWKETGSVLNYHIAGNRFLHHMVRYLVGTMIEIAKNKFSIKSFEELISFPKEDVRIFKAPPEGLILEKVEYE